MKKPYNLGNETFISVRKNAPLSNFFLCITIFKHKILRNQNYKNTVISQMWSIVFSVG